MVWRCGEPGPPSSAAVGSRTKSSDHAEGSCNGATCSKEVTFLSATTCICAVDAGSFHRLLYTLPQSMSDNEVPAVMYMVCTSDQISKQNCIAAYTRTTIYTQITCPGAFCSQLALYSELQISLRTTMRLRTMMSLYLGSILLRLARGRHPVH